jgi:hypothetical protein
MKARIVLQSIAAAVAVMAAGVASATPIYPNFTVNPMGDGSGPLTGLAPFTANDIGGQYNEQVTFVDASHFTVSLDFIAGQMSEDDTNPSNTVTYGAGATGLGVNYNLLGIFNGAGTFSTDPSGHTTFTLTPGGDLTLTYDSGAKATFAAAGGAYTISANGDTLKTLATGTGIKGVGNETCVGNNDCGDFGQTTSFNLTPNGSAYFTAPVPFYPLSLQSGQFEGVQVIIGTTQTSNGTLNAVFAAVPEPTDVALVGIALLGLGLAVKRRRSL